MKNDKTYPKEMWWHHHPVFQLDEWGNSSPRPGQEKEFQLGWTPHERAAWTYELVRRLENMLQNNWPCNQPIPSKDILQTLTQLPPYNVRHPAGKTMIGGGVVSQLGIRPVSLSFELLREIHEGPGIPSSMVEGYARIPLVLFDLTANDEPLKARFMEMINELRVERRLERRPKNQGSSHRKMKWHNLDYAHDPATFECPEKNESRCRSDLVKTALASVEAIAFGAIIALLKEQPSHRVEPLFEVLHSFDEPCCEHGGAEGKNAFPFAESLVAVTAAAARMTG